MAEETVTEDMSKLSTDGAPLPAPPAPQESSAGSVSEISTDAAIAEPMGPPKPPAFSFGTAAPSNLPAPQGFSFNLAPHEADDDDDDDDDDEAEPGAPLPKEVLQRVLGLKALHEQRDKVLEAYAKERCELEQRYRALLAPVYEERSRIVSGKLEPTLADADKQTVETSGAVESADPISGVPDFWLSALGRHEAFEHYLEEPDISALKRLVDVRCVDADDFSGFRLEFEFAENDHFTNTVLTKNYKIPNLMDANGQPELEKIEGCRVDWKNPKDCLVQREIKKRQKARRGKHAGQTRIVSKLEPQPSFFRFFESIKLPTDEDDDGDDRDDREGDDGDAVRDKIDNDVELAFALRNQIIPNAVLWFTGEAAEDDDDDDDDEAIELGPDLDDDDEDDDDDDA